MQLVSLAILAMVGHPRADATKYTVQLVSDKFEYKRFVKPVSADIDGAVYYSEITTQQNFVWKDGKFGPFSVADSPLGDGDVVSVRNGIVAITSHDTTDHRSRSFIKQKDKWIELPYNADLDADPAHNVFIYDVSKDGDAVGRWGTSLHFFRWDSKTKTATPLQKFHTQTINDDGSFTGTWRETDKDWQSSRAAVGFDPSTPILQNPDNDAIFQSYTNAKGLTLAEGQHNLFLYKKNSKEPERISRESPIPGYGMIGPFFLDPQGRVLSTVQLLPVFKAVIYEDGKWAELAPQLPADLKYENLAVWMVSKEGAIICHADPIGDPTHYVFLKLTRK